MPLQWQKIEVPLGFGIDAKAHRFVAAPPGLAGLINGRWDKDGQVNFRPGWDNLADAPSTPLSLFTYNESLYCTYLSSTSFTDTVVQAIACLNKDDTRIDQQGGFVPTNALTEAAILNRIQVSRDTTYDQGNIDDVGSSGMSGFDFAIDETTDQIVVAWVQKRDAPAGLVTTRVFACVLDLNTFAVIKPTQEVSTGSLANNPAMTVKVIREATTVHVVYDTPLTGEIRSKDYNLTTRAWGSDTVIVNDLSNAGPTWDAAEGSGVWVLAYRDTTPRLVVATIIGVGVNASQVLAEDPTSIGVYFNSTALPNGRIWVSYFLAGTGVRMVVYDMLLGAPTLAPTTVEALDTLAICIAVIETAGSTEALVCWTTMGSATVRSTSKFRTITTAGVLGTQISRYSVTLASKPVVYNSSVIYANFLYAGLTDASPVILTMALVGTSAANATTEAQSFRTVATWMQGYAGYIPQDVTATTGHPPPTFRAFGSSGEHFFPALERLWLRNEVISSVTTPDLTPRISGINGVDVCHIELSYETVRKPIEIGGNLVIPGAKTVLFDGSSVADHGMFYPPEDALMTTAAAGGLSDGSYQVALVWIFQTEHGILRSPPAFVLDGGTGDPIIDAAAGERLVLTIPTLNVTQMFNAIFITDAQRTDAVAVQIYRTEANGSILYLEGSVSNDIFAAGTAPLPFNCTATDVSLKDNAQLYTTGGILPAWPLPACDQFVVYKNRIWGISSEDRKNLVFTQALLEGEVPQHHPFLAHRIDDDGRCTGLAVMDDNLIVFKEDAVYLLRGSGPDRKGLNPDFIVTKVNTPHGCIDRRSIVADPRGVFFRSRLGLMRLTRQMEAEWVGEKIQDAIVDSINIVDAAVLPNYSERVYFLISADDGSGGAFLVYQWSNDQWSVDLLAGSESDPLAPLSIAWLNGLAYAIFAQDTTIYAHRGAEDPIDIYTLSILTQWFQFSGHQGFKRIRAIELMGEYLEPHTLNVVIQRDYRENETSQTVLWDEVETALVEDETSRYQFKIHVKEQRCESLRMAIVITPVPNDSFESIVATLTGIAFDVGIKPTMMRLPNVAMKG